MVGWFTGEGRTRTRMSAPGKRGNWRRATRAGRPEPKGRAGRSSSGRGVCPTLDSPRWALHPRRCANSRPSGEAPSSHKNFRGWEPHISRRPRCSGRRPCLPGSRLPPRLPLHRRNERHLSSRPLFRNAGSLESSVTQGSLSSIQIAFSGAKPVGSSSDAMVTSIHSAVVDSRKNKCVPQHAAKDRSRSAWATSLVSPRVTRNAWGRTEPHVTNGAPELRRQSMQ